MRKLIFRISMVAMVGLAIAPALFFPHAVHAHGGAIEGPQQVYTQAIGPYEITTIVELPPSTPALLLVDIVPRDDIGEATILLRVTPRGYSFDQAPSTQITTVPGPQGVYSTQLPVDQSGEWELELQIEGARGSGIARIPITITPTPLPPYTIPLLITLGSIFLLLLIGVGVSASIQRRERPLLQAVSRILSYAIFGCTVVAGVLGVLQWNTTAQEAQTATNSDAGGGRPHVNVAMTPSVAILQAGKPLSLTLDLTDGGTGLPVDDLVSHHEALMHLIVLDTTGTSLSHLHPARLAPGRFITEFTPDRSGNYTAYIEIERRNSGTQVIARDFSVAGSSAAPAPPAPGFGMRTIAGIQVQATSSLMPLRAARQTTLTFLFSEKEQPIRDLQPWLGMGGHLLARSADGATFAHVHAAETMVPISATSDIRYGPTVRFVYTFPQPGTYQVWSQFKRGGRILTVPLTVEVVP
ncbi:MAG TPA: hypothetical protein PKC19_07690 [Roseiflexaceae bacterium]|nr:hypothetical protein [Roseiflexaceae bacterium]